MNSSLLMMPTAQTAAPPAVRETTQRTERHKHSTDSGSTKSVKNAERETDRADTETSADTTLFGQLIASLLNMPAPAQTQTATPEASIAGASAIAAPAESAAQTEFGAAFNMEPASLVVPTNASGEPLIDPATGEFSAALLSALTPGVCETPVDNGTASVAAPVIAAGDDTTLSLTVTKFVSSDSKLVATGLDPKQMEVLKNRLEQVPANSSTIVPDDAGVITVTLAPEKPAPLPVQAPLVSNLDTVTQDAIVQTTTSAVAVTVTAPATTQTEKPATPIATDTDAAASDVVVTDTNFDPVEFRIAQKFQRPVATPAAAPVQTSTPQQPVTANSNVATHVDTGIKGKADISAALDSSMTTLPDMSDDSSLLGAQIPASSASGVPVAIGGTSILTSPVVQNASAASSHPAVQTVAGIIAKNAKEGGAQTISLRLDPPDLGKLQVKMKYEKGDPLKVHVVLEKADTAAMFQRDAHALQSALNDAGILTDGSTLSFEFSQDGSAFQNAMGDNSSSGGQSNSSEAEISAALSSPAETSMDIFTDSKTGLTHYNLRV